MEQQEKSPESTLKTPSITDKISETAKRLEHVSKYNKRVSIKLDFVTDVSDFMSRLEVALDQKNLGIRAQDGKETMILDNHLVCFVFHINNATNFAELNSFNAKITNALMNCPKDTGSDDKDGSHFVEVRQFATTRNTNTGGFQLDRSSFYYKQFCVHGIIGKIEGISEFNVDYKTHRVIFYSSEGPKLLKKAYPEHKWQVVVA